MYFKVVKMVGFTIGRQRLISLCTRHRDVPMLVSAAAFQEPSLQALSISHPNLELFP